MNDPNALDVCAYVAEAAPAYYYPEILQFLKANISLNMKRKDLKLSMII